MIARRKSAGPPDGACRILRHKGGLFLVSVPVHLLYLCLPRLVYRGGLRRAEARKIRQPGLPQRPALPDLRFRGHAGAAVSGAAAGTVVPAVPRLDSADERSGISDRIRSGKDLPRALVGLLRRALQHRRLCLPAVFHRLGPGLHLRGPALPSHGGASDRVVPPHAGDRPAGRFFRDHGGGPRRDPS